MYNNHKNKKGLKELLTKRKEIKKYKNIQKSFIFSQQINKLKEKQ